VQQRAPEPRRPKREGLCSRLILTAALSVLAVSVTAADELKPFEASYAWIWHGMNVAVSTLKLERSGDTWTYSSKSEPRGIGNLLSERPTQRSVLRVTDAGTRPLSYQASDGTSSTRRAVDVKYDWEQGRLTGVYEDTKVDLPLTPGVLDDASVQVALMVELLRGRTPEHFSLLNKNAVREYGYVREGEATLQTPLGKIATVIYRSERQGSPRVTRFWCAPWRGYVPMRVEQKRGDDIEWTMEIRSLSRE
jgi:hypothetical protein